MSSLSPSQSLVESSPSEGAAEDGTEVNGQGMSRSQALSLYTSHMLSTWNARTYEFAAVIFTATAYPDTLTASSVRGIVTALASICLSSPTGRWIDQSPNRLKTLLTTIATNRLAVILACGFWLFLVGEGNAGVHERHFMIDTFPSFFSLDLGSWKIGFFAITLILGILEKLSGSANMMSMERDWVVAVAAADGEAYDLTQLNSVMRRIDLICKLTSPILISVIISATSSVRVGVIVVGSMSASSWGLEWWCAKRVWDGNPSLRVPKITFVESDNAPSTEDMPPLGRIQSQSQIILGATSTWFRQYFSDFKLYFSSTVWIPSMALSLLHLSLLSYSATFITYLLSVGLSLNVITVATAIGSVVEISSTIVTPLGVSYLGKAHHHRRNDGDEDEQVTLLGNENISGNIETGLERLGLWGIIWQLLNLLPVLLCLWALSPPVPSPSTAIKIITSTSPPALLAIAMFSFLSFSRLGLWVFDLTTQQLTQTMVVASQRSSFAGVEKSFVSIFGLGSYIAAIVLSHPSQFKYLAAGSVAAVGISTIIYAGWVWKMRGHLVHWERVGKGCECVAGRRRHGSWGARLGRSLNLGGSRQ